MFALSQLGTGTSDIVASDDSGSYYDSTTVSDELVAMMNALGHERFCVAGHDIGMWIGFAMAADHADRVKQLAVADAMIPGVTTSPQLFGRAARNNRSCILHLTVRRTKFSRSGFPRVEPVTI